MNPIRLIGIGSEQGADRVGWSAVEQMREDDFTARFPDGLVTLEICRFPAQLMNLLEDCRYAILLDAVRAPLGTILDIDRRELIMNADMHSSHGIGVGEALGLAERVNVLPERLTILGIGVGEAHESPQVPALKQYVPELVTRCTADILAFLAQSSVA